VRTKLQGGGLLAGCQYLTAVCLSADRKQVYVIQRSIGDCSPPDRLSLTNDWTHPTINIPRQLLVHSDGPIMGLSVQHHAGNLAIVC